MNVAFTSQKQNAIPSHNPKLIGINETRLPFGIREIQLQISVGAITIRGSDIFLHSSESKINLVASKKV